ncbi:hypothetical protein V6N11_020120 [Hibiscus sabdariffa]|uniref:Uncharacterized protein n=2 Tax=Hibiscus sabdariffa TaxID=183260 RepID=A0ABR1ZV98_9ROSI
MVVSLANSESEFSSAEVGLVPSQVVFGAGVIENHIVVGLSEEGDRLDRADALLASRLVKPTTIVSLNDMVVLEGDFVCSVDRSNNNLQYMSAIRLDVFESPLLWGGGATCFGTCSNDINSPSIINVDRAMDRYFKSARNELDGHKQLQQLVDNLHSLGGCVSVQSSYKLNENVIDPFLIIPLEHGRSDSVVKIWKEDVTAGAQPKVSSHALKDVSSIELLNVISEEECEMVQCDITNISCAESADLAMNSKFAGPKVASHVF